MVLLSRHAQPGGIWAFSTGYASQSQLLYYPEGGHMRRCTALTARGTPCKAWATASSNPPRCAAHGGTDKRPGAPVGNRNAFKHGLYAQPSRPLTSIEEVIADLAEKQLALSNQIDVCLDDVDDTTSPQDIAKLFALHGQNASRLGRLLRDQRALSGEAADGIAGAIAQALDELSSELGTDL